MTAFHRSTTWAKFAKRARPIIEKTLPAPCINLGVWKGCTGVVYPGQPWDIAHRTSHHLDPFAPLTLEAVGPAHRSCNRRAGAIEGRQKQLRRKHPDPRLPKAGSGW